MDSVWPHAISIGGNLLLIGGLIFYGFRLFAEYHARGRWAKNITALLAGIGMLMLASALVFTPRNAEVILLLARTRLSAFFLWISNGLLLAAIGAFGLITYARPFRLRLERKIERDQHRDLPKIP